MNNKPTTIDDIMFPGESVRRERAELTAGMARIDALLAAVTKSPATARYTAPYTVVGHKSGYYSEYAAIQAAKAEGSRVEDAKGLVVWQSKQVQS